MENSFRLVLIILSAIIITGIFVHGLWTIRKNKRNPYKLKAKRETVEPVVRSFDQSGFDQDGVGKVKVIGKNASDEAMPEAPDVISTAVLDEDDSIEELRPGMSNEDATEITDSQSIFATPELELTPKTVETAAVEAKPEKRKEPRISFEEPVIQPKPNMKKPASPKKDQIEIEFGDPIEVNKRRQEPKVKEHALEEEVLILSVVVEQGQAISGAALLPTLLTLGMRYGEMDIFHRHQDSAGNGKITFSCANLMNPGTFDIDNMENFSTQGVSLFMRLPNAGEPATVFNQMLSAARQLAKEFGGKVLDGQRSVMTKQTEQHYLSQIREFDRKSRIASF